MFLCLIFSFPICQMGIIIVFYLIGESINVHKSLSIV